VRKGIIQKRKIHEISGVQRNEQGWFELKKACDKLVDLCIASISITDFNDTCGIIHPGTELPSEL
jgi:hypothetical protein